MVDTGAGARMTPLLGRKGRRGLSMVFFAVRPYGKGIVVYRPAEFFDTGSGAAPLIEEQLRAYSLSKAKSAAKSGK